MRLNALTLTAGLLLTGCAHNDVLVFGTDTKLALDVDSGVAEGGNPSITLGYKRKEAVWMPLVVNGRGSNVVCARESTGACKVGTGGMADPLYRSEITTDGPGGHKVVQKDAYSVFASLGAKFDAGVGNADAKASGGLAQFFATGNAAVNISRNSALVTALKLDTPEGARAQATAVQAATNSPAAESFVKQLRSKEKVLQNCSAEPGSSWKAIVAGMPAYAQVGLAEVKVADIPAALRANWEATDLAFASAKILGCKEAEQWPG